MTNKSSIKIPREINDYLWMRYLPETTYKMYLMVGYLNTERIVGLKATKLLLDANLQVENNAPAIVNEKKKVLAKFGIKYPENRKEDLELLMKYKLIRIGKNKENDIVYIYNIPVPKPQDVLNFGEEELKILENIRFEMQYQEGMNMFLTLLINNNGNFMSSVDHILKTTRIKITELRAILEYLVEEGSIKVKTDKKIEKLKKDNKVFIEIVKEVFEEKRFVVED